jgi:HSP20 family molecular chaperone IbpA
MAMVRWNPARDLVTMRDEMNRLFGEVFGRAATDEGSWYAGAWTPPVDIFETEEALVLKAELPGFTKDDISIELKENALTLRGERKHTMEAKEENYHRRERTYVPSSAPSCCPPPWIRTTSRRPIRMACSSCVSRRLKLRNRSASPSAASR